MRPTTFRYPSLARARVQRTFKAQFLQRFPSNDVQCARRIGMDACNTRSSRSVGTIWDSENQCRDSDGLAKTATSSYGRKLRGEHGLILEMHTQHRRSYIGRPVSLSTGTVPLIVALVTSTLVPRS